MADSGPTKASKDRLEAVLAAYGADPARWPRQDRALASLLAAKDPAMAASVEDARGLDSALARASRPVAPAEALERLMARAGDRPGNVATFIGRARTGPPMGRAVLPGRIAALTALAASLALGLYLGASGRGDWLTTPLLAEEAPEYLTAEVDVVDGTMQLFEEHMEP